MEHAELLLGPLLRYTDETSATVWVETTRPCDVRVLDTTAPTFEVSGHHYALVVLTGLQPGSSIPYTVRLDGRTVWPEPRTRFPQSRIRTLPEAGDEPAADGTPLRLVFGSCRKPPHEGAQSVDALARYAERMRGLDEQQWPQALLLLGDQVYADDPSPETRRWLAGRRDLRKPPGAEVVDYDDYAHLYHETWSDPAVRWLLSTVPSCMIFDDHDVRDDWNTSQAWRESMRRQPWWAERLRSAFMTYWVYQHLGNLDPTALAADPTAAAVLGGPGDRTGILRELAEIADHDLSGAKDTQWSYLRRFGRVRLLMVDSRAGRILAKGERSMLDEAEFRWVEDNLAEAEGGDVDHLLVGTSLPWLLPPAVSHVESINEVACHRPGLRGRLAEALRQAVDLEHWAAFRESFDRLARAIARVAGAERSPASVLVLSGDVHHSYFARARFDQPVDTPVYQLTCSPTHNPAPGILRGAFRAAWSPRAERATRWWSRRTGIAAPEVSWSPTVGPCFGNALTTLELEGRRAVAVLEQVEGDELTERAREQLTSPEITDRSSGARTR